MLLCGKQSGRRQLLYLELRSCKGVKSVRKGFVYVYYGDGKGKTTLAIGQGIRAVGEGLSVVMIQFLDYNNTKEGLALKKLEPDFRVFRFEKIRPYIDGLDENGRKELESELKNAFNFSKKILETGECDMLILDGIMNVVAQGFLKAEDIRDILEKKQSYMDVLITGSSGCEEVLQAADYVYHICTEKRPEE